jgi:hypothetical protein
MFSAVALTHTLQEACNVLKEQHDITCSPAKMEVYKRRFPEIEQQVRDKIEPQLEAKLASANLDTALLAAEVEQLAIRTTYQFLEEGRITDPAKAAREIAEVAAKSINNRLALQGRPTQIVENRSPAEILKRLEAMKVLKVDAETTAIEEASNA